MGDELDLFGDPLPKENPRGHKITTKPNGYYAPPGTGPAGHTCGDCKYKTVNPGRTAKIYHKCERSRGRWTGGAGTDIRVRSPACSGWAAKE